MGNLVNLLFSLFVLNHLLVAVYSIDCSFEDTHGNKYNLKALKSDKDYIISQSVLKWNITLNMCQATKDPTCGEDCAACQVWGRMSNEHACLGSSETLVFGNAGIVFD